MRKRILAALLSAAMVSMTAMPVFAAEGVAAPAGDDGGMNAVQEEVSDVIITDGTIVFGQVSNVNTFDTSTPDKGRYYNMKLPRSGRLTISYKVNEAEIVMYGVPGEGGLVIFDTAEKKVFTTEYIRVGQENITTVDLDAGDYYARVENVRGDSKSIDMAFKIDFQDSKETVTDSILDPHNSVMNAATYKHSANGMDAYLTENGPKDVFKFTTDKKIIATLTIKTTELSDMYYEFNDSVNGKVSAQSGIGIGTNSYDITLDKGTYYVAIGSNSKTGKYNFKITTKKVIKTAISSVTAKNLTYTGKNQSAKLTVKAEDGRNVGSSGYTSTFKPAKVNAIGTYTVTVKGKGDYAGTKKTTFKVVPGKPSIKATAASEGFKTSITKNGAGATNYQIQYSTNSKFPSGGSTKSVNIEKGSGVKTISGLASKRNIYVRVRSYKKVSGKTYYSSWTEAKKITTK